MFVAELTDDHREAYGTLAKRTGTIFDDPRWPGRTDGITLLGIFEQGGALVGGFRLFCEHRFGLRFYRNPPFSPHVGPFFDDRTSNPVSATGLKKAVYSAVVKYLESLSYAAVLLSFERRHNDMQPFLWAGYTALTSYTYLLDLGLDRERLWQRMSSDRRKSIRRARKDGVTVERCRDAARILPLARRTFDRQSKDAREMWLVAILERFARDDNSFGHVAVCDGEDIAATFCVHDSHTAYYLLGGYDEQRRHHGAGPACMWAAIEHAMDSGLSVFDFEGSSLQPVERYLRGFGGTLTPLPSISRASRPLSIPLKLLRPSYF